MKPLTAAKKAFLLTFLILVWGLSWPIYKVTLQYTPPVIFSGLRALVGGILLGIALLPSLKKLNLKKNWAVYSISAFFNVALFFGMQTVGLNYLPEGLFTVLVYVQPVLIGLFSWWWLGEKMTVRKIGGLILGFIGVVIISIGGLTGHVSVLGIVLALATALSWAIGVVYVKKVSDRVDPYWLVAMQSALGGLVMTAVGCGYEHVSSITWNGLFLSGLAYGAILGIPAAWLAYITLINAGEASRVAAFTFLVPLVAVLSGTLLLHEPLTVSLIVGLIAIVSGILLVNRSPKPVPNTKEKSVGQGS